MWDNMKRFHSNIIADMIDKSSSFCELSEQTIFTIAHDIAKLKEFREGEVIVYQNSSSEYNLKRQLLQRNIIKKFTEESASDKCLKECLKSDVCLEDPK